MANSLKKLSRIWQELMRRKVIYFLIGYMTASFAIIEFVLNASETFSVSQETIKLLYLLSAIGIPIVILLPWLVNRKKPIAETKEYSSNEVSSQESALKQYLTSKGLRITAPPGTSTSGTKIKDDSNLSDRIEDSIAVLPFQDMSPNRDQGYFCEGIAEEILNILAHMDSLKVVSRTSSFAYKDSGQDIKEIGRKLEVKNILEGSIRKSGNRIRITAQLINAVNGMHVWSEKYDRDITDVFAIQDEIAQAIVKNLRLSLESPHLKHKDKYQVAHIDAYLSYLRGNYHYQFVKTKELKTAIEYYTEASKIDPEFAPAYCGIARAYWSLSYWGNLPPNQAYPVIIEQMNRAKEIDSTLDEIFFLDGITNYAFLWNMDQAEDSFKKALQINPNSPNTHSSYSMLLTGLGRHNEAIMEAKEAAELDPLVSYHQAMIVNAYNFAGRYEEAIEYCLKTEKNYPENFMFSYFLGFAYHGLSRWEEAISAYERSQKISGGTQLVLANLIIAYVEMGNRSKAEELYKDLELLAKEIYVLPTHFYKIHYARQEEELAFEWLKRSVRERDGFIPFIRIHPFESIRIPQKKRYTDLLIEAGFIAS